MVAQMIVDIGNEHVEGDAPIEGMSVRLPLRAMLREGIDDLRVSLPSLRSARRTAAGGLCGVGICCLRTSDWHILSPEDYNISILIGLKRSEERCEGKEGVR